MGITDNMVPLIRGMKAHPNWCKPGHVITHEEMEAADHRHALEEAIDYFKANDPDFLDSVVASLEEGVRD